jgi:serine/threonine protein phosphatase PrpC
MSQRGKMRLEVDACTHTGRVREENQDFYGFGINEDLFVVADGMGGHPLGKEAAIVATTAAIIAKGSLEDKCISANEAVKNISNSVTIHFGSKSPGTTLLLARKVENKLELASVGDSYIMKLSDRVEILNERHEDRLGFLTGYIGMFETLPIWASSLELKVGDKYLLITDGVDALTDKRVLLDCTNSDQIVEEVLKTRAYDNITCIYITVKKDEENLV